MPSRKGGYWALPKVGPGFSRVPLFNTPLAATDLTKYLSLALSYLDNLRVAYNEYRVITTDTEPVQAQPCLIFEKIDADQSLSRDKLLIWIERFSNSGAATSGNANATPPASTSTITAWTHVPGCASRSSPAASKRNSPKCATGSANKATKAPAKARSGFRPIVETQNLASLRTRQLTPSRQFHKFVKSRTL